MRLPHNGQSRELSNNMTPMIDVVFLLIIFFLVSSHLARQESRVPLELPDALSHLPPDLAGSAFYDSVDEYREDYEFGCISQRSSTVIQHHENEPVPTPADEAVCPPETVITPDAPVLNPTIAPEVCPPDQECPPATDCQHCPQEQSCQGCQPQSDPETNCTDCEQEQQF